MPSLPSHLCAAVSQAHPLHCVGEGGHLPPLPHCLTRSVHVTRLHQAGPAASVHASTTAAAAAQTQCSQGMAGPGVL